MQTVPVTPLPASSVLMLRDGAAGVEVFMVQRSPLLNFSSGKLVFPGGKIDPEDRDPAWRGLAPGGAALADEALARRIGAIREAFEETGALLARGKGGGGLAAAEAARITARWRRPVHAGQVPFMEVLAAERLEPAVDALVPFTHWITPEHSPRRFDVHFFAAAMPAGQAPAHDGVESVDSFWLAAAEGVADSLAGRRPIMLPTRANLAKAAQGGSVAEVLAAAARERVVTMMGGRAVTETGIRMGIPDAGPGGPGMAAGTAQGGPAR